MPLRGMFPHEMAIRLVLQSLSVSASRYRRYIVPLVSCSVDFYLRVFLRVYTSPKEVKKTASKTGLFYECSGCHSYHVQPLGKINDVETGPIVNALCEHCHHPHFIGGPAYAGNIHNKDFVANLLEHIDEDYGTYERLRGMLSVIHEETEDAPLYWTLGRLTRVLKCNSMKLRDLYSAIANAGFDVSSSHCDPLSIKTNAPPKVIWDIFRAWIKHHPVVMKNIPEGAPARAILSACNELDVDFTRHHDVYNTVSRMQKLTRYQVNPTAHWGPKPRA